MQHTCSAAKSYPISPVNEVDGENIKVRLFLACISALNNVVSNLASSIVFWSVPGQVARVCFDV